MRRRWLIALMTVVVSCTDDRLSTAPETTPAPEAPATATTSEASPLAPLDGDRILIDTRTKLQEATSRAQAIQSFGQANAGWLWYFTTNVDGQGTNALRIDWPKRPRNSCSYQTTTLSVPLPAPAVNQLVIQWKHRLGRTATGGGFGEIGQFSLVDHGCPDGRHLTKVTGQSTGDAAQQMTYQWTGGAPPIAPLVIRPGAQPLRIDALAPAVDFQSYVGRTVTQTLLAVAESSPGASDGIVALWIDAQLVLAKTGLPLAVSQFNRIVFAGRSPLARQRQSEYFWDVVVWKPQTLPIPRDIPPNPTVGSVTVAPPSARLPVGTTIDLVATVRDINGNILPVQPVTWQSSDDAIASVSATGRVTAHAVGAVTISASAAGISGTSAVTVDPAPPIPVSSVVVSPASATIQIGGTAQLAAVARDAAGNALTGRAIGWSSGNEGVATVDQSGLVRAVSAGTVTITATSEGVSGTSSVTVTPLPPAPVASVAISPATSSLTIGQTQQLTATLRDAAGNILTGRSVSWGTSADGIASVSSTGLVTAVAVGNATITATSEGVSGTAAVTVAQVPVATVTVTPATASIATGATVQLTAVARDASGNPLSGRSFTWSSGTPGIATVNASGLVTAVAAGSATIRATSEGVIGSSNITVTGPPPDATPPSVPQNLIATAISSSQVNLSWSASSDNVGVTGYRVFRNGTQVGAPAGPSFQDVTVAPSTTYSYAVAAVDAVGNVSGQSLAVSVTTPAPPGGGGMGSALPARLPLSTGAVFYVAPNGSNTNAGTIDAPWQTIQKALNTLSPGQKAFVRGGRYPEALTLNRAGTAGAPITIEAFPGEVAIIDGEHVRRPLVIQSGGAYFRIKGFILDRDCCTSGGHIDVYGHHIEIVDNEMRNGRGKGVYTDEGSSNVHIIGNWIHHNVTAGGQQDHGLYMQGNDHFIANNVIHDHPDGFGIQIYDRGSRMIVVNNTVTNNGHSGIVVGGSGGVSNITIRNNILANNNFFGVQMDSSCPTSNVVIDVNVIFGNGDGAVEGGCSAVSVSGTIAANPLFVNAGSTSSRNLRVQAGSPAINAARADFAMPIAFGNSARVAPPDIGAYEFGVP